MSPGSGDGTDRDAVTEFAARLRELRIRSGSPSYRHLARLTHYSSSTLADAAGGKRLPTQAVMKAFVTACGDNAEEWIAPHRAALAATKRWADSPVAVTSTDAGVPVSAGLSRKSWSVRYGGAVVIALGLLGIGTVVGTLAGASRAHEPAPSSAAVTAPFTAVPSAVPSARSVDGQDPIAADCTSDAQLVDQVPVLIDGTQVGALDLKYSPHCGSGWARAFLYPAQPTMVAEVSVWSGDGRASSLAEPMIKQVSIYTKVIVPGPTGCLGATAIVLETGRAPVRATIPCQRLTG
jgi:Protein of unknown function (DUF2690)/Helix-turn-helix domain